MADAMALPRETLDWRRPLVPQVVERLLARAFEPGLDLGDAAVVVPTLQAGRRLREALAAAAGDRGRALLPPAILTPDRLLLEGADRERVASDETVIAAWNDVLGQMDAEAVDALFPVPPPDSAGWRLGTAQRFADLRLELGEEGWSFADVAAAVADEPSFEPERWAQLAALERAYFAALGKRDLVDPSEARREVARNGASPFDRIFVAATPDPLPLAARALERFAASAEVVAWIYGPRESDALFDGWGRPRPDAWSERPLNLEAPEVGAEVAGDPRDAAREVAARIGSAPPEAIAVGLADARLNPCVAAEMTARGQPWFDPAGEPLRAQGPGRLLDSLARFAEDASVDAVRELLQHPAVQRWIRREVPDLPPERLLAAVDRIHERHLAPDLGALERFARGDDERAADAAPALRLMESLRERLNPAEGGFAEAAREALTAIFGDAPVDAAREEDRRFAEQAAAVAETLERVGHAEAAFPADAPEIGRRALRSRLRRARVHPDRPAHAHDLQGWLELLWNDAPRLTLAGLNEGIVPEPTIGDAFVPAGLRERLGLRAAAFRFGRDAYMLASHLARRAEGRGRVDLIIPREAPDRAPLRPSRLLFLGDDSALLARARRLFGPPPAPRSGTPRGAAWRLRPPPSKAPPSHLSVSALKAYLACPFRFFLRYIVDMREVDATQREMPPTVFGEVVHAALRSLEGARIDANTRAENLAAGLEQAASREARKRFADPPSFALRLQVASIQARLRAMAEAQAEAARQGGPFTVEATETRFEASLDRLPIRGRIDRVDRFDDGRARLVDYKTSDQPTSPAKAHLRKLGKRAPPEHLPPEAFVDIDGAPHVWTDLQLPLYALAQPEKARPAVAYLHLPKSADKAGLETWDALNGELLDSARACARAVERRILDGVFWPPNPDIPPSRDDFAALFPEGVEAAVDPEGLDAYPFSHDTDQAKGDAP